MAQTSGYTKSAGYAVLEDLQKESIDFALIYCGKEQCERGHRFGPNCRKRYVLHIVLEGKGILETGGKTYHLGPNDAFILFPHVEAYYEADAHEPWAYVWVGFDGVKSYMTMINAGFSEKEPVKEIPSALTARLCSYIEQMLDASQLTFANELKRNSYLMLFFADLVENYQKAQQTEQNDFSSVHVKHALEYITHHFQERIRINELAGYIGVNRSYLTNSFKRAFGLSPQELLINLRMEKASALLQNTALPVRDIAAQVGYEDSLAFSKIFKKYTGISPRQFRSTPIKLLISDEKGQYTQTVL